MMKRILVPCLKQMYSAQRWCRADDHNGARIDFNDFPQGANWFPLSAVLDLLVRGACAELFS